MAGLVPAIHVFLLHWDRDVDARDKPGHNGPFQFRRKSTSTAVSCPAKPCYPAAFPHRT